MVVLAGDGQYWTGGGATYIGGGGWVGGQPGGSIVPNASITIAPNQYRLGPPKLSEEQVQRLIQEHRFIPMDDDLFCLFCYALDLWRTAKDHLFVIREE